MKYEFFKTRLEDEKSKLESEMSKMGRKNEAVPGDWEPVTKESIQEPDIADQAEGASTRDTNNSIFSDLEARYDMVIGALKRIDGKTYGTCGVCGAIINEERLEADPATISCGVHA